MMLIGVDPHESTHTATAVDPAMNSDRARPTCTGARTVPPRLTAIESDLF